MNVEVTERIERRGQTATVTDTRGRVAVQVVETESPIDKRPIYHAVGGWLSHIDGDSLAIRTLYAADMTAAVAEARALLVREVADHAAKVEGAIRQLTEGGRADGDAETQSGSDGEAVRRPAQEAAVAVVEAGENHRASGGLHP